MSDAFWASKSLEDLTALEWEALCDGCGRCCLHKLEDEDTGEVFYTRVACRQLDLETCRCKSYADRTAKVPGCIDLKANPDAMAWLPSTCAYRLRQQGEPLPVWHPLVSGDGGSAHKAGISIRHFAVPESGDEDLEDFIIEDLASSIASRETNRRIECLVPAMSDNDEDSLFFKEMQDVRPLKKVAREPEAVKDDSWTPALAYRRERAQKSLTLDETQLPTTFVEPVRPEAIISFKREGIQSGVFRRLQRGDYPHEAMLDLHGLTVEQARQELYRFVADCLHYDVRSALISHGKGRGNKDQIPLLKSFLVRWLPMFPEVMAYHSAQKWHGGAGAVYVLFRKTEKAKNETRERLRLGSGKPDV